MAPMSTRSPWRRAALAAFAGIVVAASSLSGADHEAGAPAKARLTGRWTLDPQRSDDAGDKVRKAMPGTHVTDRAPGRREPTGSGIDVTTPGVSGVGLPPGSGPTRRGVPTELIQLALRSPAQITIAERNTEVLIEEERGRVRAIRPDGRTYDNRGARTRARWAGGALVVDTWPDASAKVRETYAAEPEGDRLNVTLEIVMPQILPLTVKRVYARWAPGGHTVSPDHLH
jgi:hypothetical protein